MFLERGGPASLQQVGGLRSLSAINRMDPSGKRKAWGTGRFLCLASEGRCPLQGPGEDPELKRWGGGEREGRD